MRMETTKVSLTTVVLPTQTWRMEKKTWTVKKGRKTWMTREWRKGSSSTKKAKACLSTRATTARNRPSSFLLAIPLTSRLKATSTFKKRKNLCLLAFEPDEQLPKPSRKLKPAWKQTIVRSIPSNLKACTTVTTTLKMSTDSSTRTTWTRTSFRAPSRR